MVVVESQKKPPMSPSDSLVVVVVFGHIVVESQKKPPTSHLDLLVVVLDGGGEPEKTTNKSLGLIGGDGGVESQKKESLGLVGGGVGCGAVIAEYTVKH